MDELIENLYMSEEYQQFKKRLKKEYECVGREDSLKDISFSLEKMRFSKIGKYKDLDNRVGIVAGPKSGNVHSFLFKKVKNQWKIEKEKWPMIKYFFDEHLAAKQLLEQKNNETPEARIVEYLEAIQRDNKIKALEIWQLAEEDENWKANSDYSLLEKRRDNITEELIKKKIKNFEIINIEWRSISIYTHLLN